MTDTPAPVSAEAPAPDIVERLRRENAMPPYYGPPKLQEEAADTITALRADVERLRRLGNDWLQQMVDQRKEITALRAEIERLRLALARGADR